jgi:EmrB/QacA subfamily drug resistance transporter
MAALMLVTALASFESTVVSTAMPTIIGDLHGLPLYSWVFSLYLLSATVMMPLFGSLADLHGRRRVLLVALTLFLAGALCCAAARSMTQLIAARTLQGLGAAGLVPISLTVVADLYELRERPRVQGIFSAIWASAGLIGPLVGAWLTVSFGWRSIFSINLPLGALAFTLVATQMRESRARSPLPFDYLGAALLAVAVSALLLATLHRGGDQDMGGFARGSLLALALAALLLLVRSQKRAAHPLLPPALFTRAETAAPYLAGVLLGTTIFGVDTFVPLFVQGARGGTATAAGAVVTPVILMWAVSASLAARTILGHGFRRSARIGALLVLAGFALLLTAVLREWSVLTISLACALIGCGLGFSSLPQILAVQHAVAEKDRGVATSLVPFMRAIGGAVGVGALGGILSASLSRRLGPLAAEASQLLAGHPVAGGGLQPEALRESLTAALLPIFALLAALAVLNLAVTAFFPAGTERAVVPLP